MNVPQTIAIIAAAVAMLNLLMLPDQIPAGAKMC